MTSRYISLSYESTLCVYVTWCKYYCIIQARFPLGDFFRAKRLFPLSASLITSANAIPVLVTIPVLVPTCTPLIEISTLLLRLACQNKVLCMLYVTFQDILGQARKGRKVKFRRPVSEKLPCEQSRADFPRPKRKIDSALFVFCFVQEFGRRNLFLMCAALFILLTDD